jgi:hypothetical protein
MRAFCHSGDWMSSAGQRGLVEFEELSDCATDVVANCFWKGAQIPSEEMVVPCKDLVNQYLTCPSESAGAGRNSNSQWPGVTGRHPGGDG